MNGTITQAPASEQTAPSPSRLRPIEELVVKYGAAFFLVGLIAAFSIALPTLFPTLANAQVILGSQAVPAMLALAVIFPLVGGEFDLSAGAVLGFCSIISAQLAVSGQSLVVALLITVAVGVLIGVVNGLMVTVIGVGAFIATLGVATILAGGNLLVTNGTLISKVPGSVTDLGQGTFLSIPTPVFYALGIALITYYVLDWTPVGRYLQATGLGRDAARLAGVRTQLWLFASFVLSGALAALAGFVQTARVGSAPPTIGPEFLLPAYAAAFLGATTIRPGRFNVWGTMVGVLILAVGISGLNLAGAPFWVPSVFNGMALLLAVSVSVWVAKQRQRRGGAA